MPNKKSFEEVSARVQPPHTYPVLSFIVGLMAISILIAAGVFAYTTYLRFEEERVTSSFTVQGEASQTVAAREASFSFSVVRQGEDVPALNEEVDTVTNDIRTYLNDLGLTGNDIQINKQTYEDFSRVPFDVEPPASEGEELLRPQVVATTFNVTVDDLDTLNLNEIIREVTTRGASQVTPATFTAGNSEEVCRVLVDRAIEDARERAESRLQALGGEAIVRTEVQETGGCGESFYGTYFAETDAAVGSEAAPAPDILSGSEELRARVNLQVEYR